MYFIHITSDVCISYVYRLTDDTPQEFHDGVRNMYSWPDVSFLRVFFFSDFFSLKLKVESILPLLEHPARVLHTFSLSVVWVREREIEREIE